MADQTMERPRHVVLDGDHYDRLAALAKAAHRRPVDQIRFWIDRETGA